MSWCDRQNRAEIPGPEYPGERLVVCLDPLRAQRDNVRTLEAMGRESVAYPERVRRGVRARLRQGRLNLGYALARSGRRWAAARAVLPTLWRFPQGLRDVLSMVRG